MTDLNHVILMGRITKDLDENAFGYFGSIAKATVSIAVNRSVKKNEEWVDEVSFFDVNIWGKTAENLKPYLTKGQQICIDGSLKQDRWEKDGQKFSKIVINTKEVFLAGGKKNSDNNSTNTTSKQGFKSGNQASFSENDFPEDIPF